MARLNGLATSSGRGVYWQLIDVGGPDVLTIAVNVMREHANKAMTSSRFPPWVSGKVSVRPSVEEGLLLEGLIGSSSRSG
jgi:hypothetical protein